MRVRSSKKINNILIQEVKLELNRVSHHTLQLHIKMSVYLVTFVKLFLKRFSEIRVFTI